MKPLFKIKDWDRSFENSDTRKLKHLAWTPVTTKLAGKSYARIVAHPRACEILAAFEAMRKVAANAPRRGYLEDHDGPLDADDLSAITRLPVEAFEIAFEVLVSERISWLEVENRENPPKSAAVPGDSPDINGKSGESPDVPGDSPDVPGEAPDTSRLQDITRQDSTDLNKRTPRAKAEAAGLDLPADPVEAVRILLGAVMVGHTFDWGANAPTAGGARATVAHMLETADVDAVVLELHGLYKLGPPGKSFKAATQISELIYWRDKRQEEAAKATKTGKQPETFNREEYATGRLK